LPFPIDLLRRPYNSVALPCDTVMPMRGWGGVGRGSESGSDFKRLYLANG